MTLISAEIEENDVSAEEELRPKIGKVPVKLRLLSDHDSEAGNTDWADAATITRKGDTQFMALLVTLIVVVNFVLIALLNHKENPPTTPASSQTGQASAPTAAAATSKPTPTPPTTANKTASTTPVATSKTLQPAQTTPVQPSTPAAALPKTISPAKPLPSEIHATAPASANIPSPDLSRSYVTPVTPATAKAVAAPVQPVTVVEHKAPAVTAGEAARPAPSSTFIKELPGKPATLAPAAGRKSSTSPTDATQDLLSVIGKD